MSYTLHFHPLSSYCQKVLVALYELAIPFDKNVVDLSDPAHRAALAARWPIGKFPVLTDDVRGVDVAESTTVIEHLDAYAESPRLVPLDTHAAREIRFRDRFFDLYVNTTMQKIVTDNLRPAGKRDPHGVEEADAKLAVAYDVVNGWVATSTWAYGESFSMADCAAAPALFYAHKIKPIDARHPDLAAYYARLEQRPSFARVLAEAEPYLKNFPGR